MLLINDYLSQFSGQRVVYIPNPGNAGDSVIAAATFQMLEKNNIKYELAAYDRIDPTGQVVIYGGGGNLVATSTFSARVIKRLHKRAKKLVILPHTIKNIDELLVEFGSNVDIICRERYSLDYLQRSNTDASVHLAHDMAFSLDIEKLKLYDKLRLGRQIYSYATDKLIHHRNTVSWNNLIRASRVKSIVPRLRASRDTHHLNCFRLDGERTSVVIPDDNVDLSQEFQFGLENAELAYFCTQTLLTFLSRYKSISTNRLHLAISSALLGLQVQFYSNSYYKCKGVYELSMRERLPNVEWMSG